MAKGLPPQAYQPCDKTPYPPYVSPNERPIEATVRSVLFGALFGILFGSANAYLGLRVGLTISTSIPIAVLSVIAFMTLPPFGRIRSILELNLSQTIGSASSSLASGIIFTIPALFLWQQNPSLSQLIIVSCTGGLLGVLWMIPLRKALIVKEHGRLQYPEGMACAEVLVAADQGGQSAKPVLHGMLIGVVAKWLVSGLRVIGGDFHLKLPFIKKAELGIEFSPALIGVGYILGLRLATVMVAGSLLSSLIIIPILAYWGDARSIPLYPETVSLIRDMSASQIWSRYVRYIGAGAVAYGGFVTLFRTLPTLWSAFESGLKQLRGASDAADVLRTDRDIPMSWVVLGVFAVLSLIFLLPGHTFLTGFESKLVTTLLIAVCAFFFVTVSSRVVGYVGVSSNPTSGMTIATLLVVCGSFFGLGWMGPSAMAQALVIATSVAVAASIAGDTSQDLKTGFLLGATPMKQQVAQIVGVCTSVTFVCMTVVALEKTYGFGTKELPAPQAMLMKLVTEGILSETAALPWSLVFIGVGLAAFATLLRVPVLPFAVGLYLPLSSMFPVFLGGLVRWLTERKVSEDVQERRRERGILVGSGFVAGEGLVGVGIAIYALVFSRRPEGLGTAWSGPLAEWLPLIGILALIVVLFRYAKHGSLRGL